MIREFKKLIASRIDEVDTSSLNTEGFNFLSAVLEKLRVLLPALMVKRSGVRFLLMKASVMPLNPPVLCSKVAISSAMRPSGRCVAATASPMATSAA